MIDKYFPKKSKIKQHDSISWVYFLKSINPNPNLEGTYLPRTLTVHLKKETKFLEINIFHEYNGHGSFCEYSKIGRKIVQYEQELVEIEKQILVVNELCEDKYFQITQNSPFFNQYKQLRRELEEFLFKHHNYYEGFAYWVEKCLAINGGLGELYEQRKNKIEPFYLELVDSFEQFVKNNSVENLLEKISFE